VPRDYVSAYMWFTLAAAGGNEGQIEVRRVAAGARGGLAAKMTPAQIAEAQRRAAEWRPKMWPSAANPPRPQPGGLLAQFDPYPDEEIVGFADGVSLADRVPLVAGHGSAAAGSLEDGVAARTQADAPQEQTLMPRGRENPSFNCAPAKTAAARLICADAKLARLDGELGVVFQKRKAQSSGHLEQ
jgi:hypothetical protein